MRPAAILSGLSSLQPCLERETVLTTLLPALLNCLIPLHPSSLTSARKSLVFDPSSLSPDLPALGAHIRLLISHCMIIIDVCLPQWTLSLKQFLAHHKQSKHSLNICWVNHILSLSLICLFLSHAAPLINKCSLVNNSFKRAATNFIKDQPIMPYLNIKLNINTWSP